MVKLCENNDLASQIQKIHENYVSKIIRCYSSAPGCFYLILNLYCSLKLCHFDNVVEPCMCTVLTSWDAFPLMLPHQQLHQEMVTFIEPVAKSQSSNKDDCSLKMILIFKFGPFFFGYAQF